MYLINPVSFWETRPVVKLRHGLFLFRWRPQGMAIEGLALKPFFPSVGRSSSPVQALCIIASCEERTLRTLQICQHSTNILKMHVVWVKPSLFSSLNFSASKVENTFKEPFKLDTGICAISCYLTVFIFHLENGFFNGQNITRNSCDWRAFLSYLISPKHSSPGRLLWVKVGDYRVDCSAFLLSFKCLAHSKYSINNLNIWMN